MQFYGQLDKKANLIMNLFKKDTDGTVYHYYGTFTGNAWRRTSILEDRGLKALVGLTIDGKYEFEYHSDEYEWRRCKMQLSKLGGLIL